MAFIQFWSKEAADSALAAASQVNPVVKKDPKKSKEKGKKSDPK